MTEQQVDDLKFYEIPMFYEQISYLDQIGIVYVACKFEAQRDNTGKCKYDSNGRLLKNSKPVEKYSNITVTPRRFDRRNNGVGICLGPRYNLIGIDVDNKDDTVAKFLAIMKENNSPPTLTVSTINEGFHYHYTLSREQEDALVELKFKCENNILFGLHVDVKYDNQVFYGPGYIEADDDILYVYDLIDRTKPAQLPDYIFNELIRNLDPIRQSSVEINKSKTKPKIKSNLEELTSESILFVPDEDIDSRLANYLALVNKTRWDNYEDWFKLGAIIYYEGGSFRLFDELSKQSHKYDHKACKRTWNSYDENRTFHWTIATLMKIVREDNWDGFNTVHNADTMGIVNDIISNGPLDRKFAKLFYQLYCTKFVFDTVTNSFYAIDEFNIWYKDNQNSLILNEIDHLTPYITSVYRKLSSNYTGEIKKKYYDGYYKAVNYLGHYRNIHNISLYTKLYFKKGKMYELFNNVNNKLFAFTNGVYDLEIDEFRLPKPEEYIMVTAGYDYRELDNTLTGVMEEIRTIFRSIVKEDDDMEYLLMTIAQSLAGDGSQEEAFYIWKGQGGNGKGVVRDFIQETYGNYFDAMEIDYLTSKADTSSSLQADPIMAKKKDVRIVITTEPEGGIKLKSAKLKQISGKDPIQCRHLYGGAFSFVAKFNIFIQTNHEVKLDATCNGIIRRLNVQNFPYDFVSKPKLPNEKQKDKNLKSKIKTYDYKIAFFHLLLEYYYKLKEQGEIIKSKDIKAQIKLALIDNDPITPFFHDKVKFTSDKGDKIKSSDLFKIFQDYCEGNTKGVNASKFKSAVCRAGAQPCILNGHGYYRKIKVSDDSGVQLLNTGGS